MQEIILVGWKAIAEACGNLGVDTMREWARKYNLPFREVNHKPVISCLKLEKWAERLPQKSLKSK